MAVQSIETHGHTPRGKLSRQSTYQHVYWGWKETQRKPIRTQGMQLCINSNPVPRIESGNLQLLKDSGIHCTITLPREYTLICSFLSVSECKFRPCSVTTFSSLIYYWNFGHEYTLYHTAPSNPNPNIYLSIHPFSYPFIHLLSILLICQGLQGNQSQPTLTAGVCQSIAGLTQNSQ